MDDWLQVTAIAPPAAGEAVSAALFTAGAGGVWEDNPDPLGRLVFKAGFDSGQEMRLMAELPEALNVIAQALEISLLDFELTLELKPGEDYSETWKKDLKPITVSDDLVVCPSWWAEPLDAPPSAKVLKLDPGSAFGSGHHPTTFMCLRLLSELVEKGVYFNNLLDLGAGSAILALCAALLLPKAKITAIDNDPETLFAAQKNVGLNNLTARLTPETANLEDLSGQFDLIMANLTRNVLISLSKSLAQKSTIPGRLILSGLLAKQVPDVLKTFGALGFKVETHLGQDEWSALSLIRGLEIAENPERQVLESLTPMDPDLPVAENDENGDPNEPDTPPAPAPENENPAANLENGDPNEPDTPPAPATENDDPAANLEKGDPNEPEPSS
ncbi:MAG: 50S ribosomal protein L11 methyltransferase [Deltaproteobacteria bacterium]|jgi:ribosomal protein L11 methyltransferase|nr:50S ribosomal protein L11 methyltransferase [Deltaproteobacteria bacterium]